MEDINTIRTIAVAVAVYFAAHLLLSIAVVGRRKRMFALIRELKADPRLNDGERAVIAHMADTAYSVRGSILLALTYLQNIFTSLEGLERERHEFMCSYPNLLRDERASELLEAHVASVVAANPVFGVCAYLLREIWRYKLRLVFHRRSAVREVAMNDFLAAARV